ncbi:B3 domain-containing transcription factor NGA1-like [Melia azedarach]|uniref:B3 domain-containing transcription factor NGA1-like n=1 Tax=Melia azedarach TaxID=155640 RepID=A0ACC1YWT5_MELAZ|nr:B3 domain-containing transcription factor NGA1-like [Melia azedarach]
MNFVQEEKGYCNNEEEDEDQKEMREASQFPFSSSSSSSVASSKYKAFVPHHHRQNVWLGNFDSPEAYRRQDTAINLDKKVELMDLSLGNNEEACTGNGGGDSSRSNIVEKEHMFDKVVTPSDVGKLNRLVIPKQHAEKYFPLDSSSNEKGLLLNFEDRNGKAWRFRYSYWNSSQSYVMTKGWSRFVKEKKLDAGDIVSFQRGVGELGKDRLYIDWRRRPDAPDPTALAQMQLQNQLHFQQSVRWGRLYSLPQSVPNIPRNYDHLQRMNYNTVHPYYHHHHHHHQQHHHHHHHQQQQQQQVLSYGNAPVQYYLRPSGSQQIEAMQEGGNVPMVIDSVPVVHGKSTAAKRLRLFGVNMECSTQGESSSTIVPGFTMSSVSPHLTSSYVPPHQSREPSSASSSRTTQPQYSNKGKSSLSFDLDL